MSQGFESLQDRLTMLGKDLDIHLESVYGDLYPLHPNRLPHGRGANPSYDGLFSTTIGFSTGYGTKSGRGYVVSISIRTLSMVSQDSKDKVEEEAYAWLQTMLPERFPERKLMVVSENGVLKIIGDFSIR